ncbi:MAG: penicillin-binding protein activator [Novosphingobium sp.]|nr:penicillin-binding protein activator [Novosphingobium sp.]
MFESGRVDRRRFVTIAALTLLSGCQMIPPGVREEGPPPPQERPSANALPSDVGRHRVALLVPMSGANSGVGQSIANATTMALLDTNAQNLRITTYDTSTGAEAAAARAIAEGNRLILGPLLGEEVAAVSAAARPARVPVISYSNDHSVAGHDVFIMGSLPGQSIVRTVSYARAHGAHTFAALIPNGTYGQRASAAFVAAVREAGGTVAASESYDRANTSIVSAAHRLAARGPFDAVLIADGGRIAATAAPLLKSAAPHLLGTELWSGEAILGTVPALRGAWFSAVPDTRFRQFAESYKSRFGAQPYRLATLGYDSVLLTLRVAREWRPGTTFPTERLDDPAGFLGLDGPFRFLPSGVIERAFEVREVRAGGPVVVSPAPSRFAD